MKAGDVVLVRLPTVRGQPPKLRPALVLTILPGPYQNVLLCGISTQLHLLQSDWDEVLSADDSDFSRTGLRRDSAARLSYLYAAAPSEVSGVIGQINAKRLKSLQTRLANRLIGSQE